MASHFNGAGPAASFNVYIYAANGCTPGAVFYSTLNQPYVQAGSTFTVVTQRRTSTGKLFCRDPGQHGFFPNGRVWLD